MTRPDPGLPARGSAPLSIRATRDVPPAEWDARVQAMHGNAFHSAGWADVLEASGRERWFLEFLVGDGPAGFAVAGGARSHLPLIGAGRSELELNTTPILRADVDLHDAARALRSFARQQRFGWLQCSAYATACPAATEALRALGFAVTPRLEFPMPLANGFDTTLAAMSSGHRRNVRKAMDEGFDFREDSTIAGAMTLRQLQDATYGRRRELGQTHARSMSEEHYGRTMGAWLRAQRIRLWFVERDGRPLSALGILVFGSRAYYLVGGTAAEGYQVRAPFAAFGHVIRELCAVGVSELHLGGVPAGAAEENHPDHGLYRFKRGFGGEPVTAWDARVRA